MSDHKSPVDQALDLLLYAPLGFALDARTLVPKLVDRGRSQMTTQLTMARMIGKFAVQQGQQQAVKRVSKAQNQATVALNDLGLLPRPTDRPGPDPVRPAPTTSTPAPPPATTPTPTAAEPEAPVPPRARARSRTASRAKAAPAVTADALAVPDYDSLAASQVIPRLAGLAAAELEAVRSYEAGHRGRKTILSKIAQLQD